MKTATIYSKIQDLGEAIRAAYDAFGSESAMPAAVRAEVASHRAKIARLQAKLAPAPVLVAPAKPIVTRRRAAAV